MSEITYNKDFVKRTRKLLEINYDYFKEKDLEVTFLMNCLLGLIIAISENKNFKKVLNNNIDDDFLSHLPEKMCFIKLNNTNINLEDCSKNNIKFRISKKEDLKSEEKKWFINKLRNGIAHQHIKEINNKGKWTGVEIWNEANNNNIIDFRISFLTKELRQFVLFLSEQCI